MPSDIRDHQNGDRNNPSSNSFSIQDHIRLFSSRDSNLAHNRPPPPIPPKPRAVNDSSIGETGFRKYSASSKTIIHTTNDQHQSSTGRIYPNQQQNFDLYSSDISTANFPSPSSRDEFNQTSKILIGETTKVAKQQRTQMSCVYDSTAIDSKSKINEKLVNLSINSSGRGSSRPIVTESPEETNNNNNHNDSSSKSRMKNTSTVEILEVPYQQRSRNGNYGNITTTIPSDMSDPTNTYVRPQQHIQQQQPFYINRSYASQVVTAPVDDDEEEFVVIDGSTTTKLPVQIINDHNDDASHPPRTSTPNTTAITAEYNIQSSSPSSSSGTSTATNQHAIKAFRLQQEQRQQNLIDGAEIGGAGHNESFQTDDDFANTSKDTDELSVNTSGLNQSGCEIVGVNGDSDQLCTSKDSHAMLNDLDKKPFTLRALENTPTMSASDVPQRIEAVGTNGNHDHIDQTVAKPTQINQNHLECSRKIQDLENLTQTLLAEIDRLKLQVASMTTKISELERTKPQPSNRSLYEPQLDSPTTTSLSHSNGPRPQQQVFSKSTTTINRLSSQPNPIASSTYSRSQNTSRAPRSNDGPYNQYGTHSKSMYSTNNAAPKPLKKSAYAASTNSIYADSLKSSISPTPNQGGSNNNRQSISPTSMMSLSRREPSAYTSMLSLTSIGHPANSLKRGAAISGSISNLSQIGSQISSWPSESNFLTAKNPAKDIIYDEKERVIRMLLYNTLIPIRVPNHIPMDYNIDKVIEPPSVKLKLDWVYGYRGRDCRSNLFHLPTGECVYFVASIVVLFNPDQKTQRHYLGHTDSVKCLAVHPNKLIIASGQSSVLNRKDKRPIVRVWNTVSLATLRVIGFNEDFDRSICCLAFSKHDQGATLAVVDESTEHTITLLDWQREKSWRIAEANSGHDPVLAIDFHPLDKYSLVAVGRSTVNFWDIRGLTLAKKAGLFDKYDKPKYVLCLTFNDFGDTITGDSNGNIIIWPRGSNRPKRVVYDAHQGGVFSVLAMKDGSYLTGGRDRRIVEWDENLNPTGREAELPEHCGGVRYITCGRGSQALVGTLRNSILVGSLDTGFKLVMQGHAEATSSLAIHPIQQQYLTGGFDDQIHLFDSRTRSVLWSKCVMMPATAACYSPNGLLIIIGSTSGKWLVLDATTEEILFTSSDGSGTISCIKFSPSGEYFCMGSSDMQAYVYQASEAGNKFTRVGTCVGHSAPVKEMDWSEDSRYLQTQSMNFELLFWRAANCRPLEDPKVIDDLKWFTQNCTIGFNVIGLWSNTSDASLVNCCDKSSDDELMVSATDSGHINVFKWPTCYNDCLPARYFGNVDKFNFIKFLPDDTRLIAVGAKNCVTTEWVIDQSASL